MPRSGWAYTDLGYFNELGGMTGSVQFRTDCNSLSGSTNFVFASSSNRVGIRYDLTQPGFDIQRGSTALPLYHPNAALEVRGDMNVTGSIYAKNYYIQNVSFMDLTGSTKFGDTAGDTHKFIGKVGIGTSFETGPSSDRRDPQSLLHLEHTDTTTWPSTITASDEEYSDFLLSLRNHTDTQHAFAGISFDVTSEIDADSLGAAIVAVSDNTTSAAHDANLAFATNDAGDDGLTERMRITHDGKVGIGTATPDAPLHIEYDGAGSLPSIDDDTIAIFQRNLPGSAGAAISIIGHVAGDSIVKLGDTDDEDIGRIRYQHTNNSMDFFTNNSEAMTIDSSGKVGIGLPAPGAPLEVRDGTGTAQLKLSYDASNYANLTCNSAGSLLLSPSSEYVILDATTATYVQGDLLKVGRGTTADTTITFDGSTNDMSIVYDESAKTLAFDTDDLFIDAANGKVGIGVADPDSALEVFSTSTQQKWSYDSDSFATFTVAADSHTTLATGEDGNFTLDAEGDIVLDADGGNIYLKDAGATYIEFQIDGTNDKMVVSGGLTIDASDDIVLDADGDQISMKFGGSNGQIDFSNANSGDGIIRQMVDAKDLVIQQYDGTEVVRFGDDRKLYFYDKGGEYIHGDGTNLIIASGNDIVCSIPAGSALEPSLNNLSDLGSASKRWANVYTGDLHLKNDRGDWTVVEESEYLTLVNNANGKKYKIMMEEIED